MGVKLDGSKILCIVNNHRCLIVFVHSSQYVQQECFPGFVDPVTTESSSTKSITQKQLKNYLRSCKFSPPLFSFFKRKQRNYTLLSIIYWAKHFMRVISFTGTQAWHCTWNLNLCLSDTKFLTQYCHLPRLVLLDSLWAVGIFSAFSWIRLFLDVWCDNPYFLTLLLILSEKHSKPSMSSIGFAILSEIMCN